MATNSALHTSASAWLTWSFSPAVSAIIATLIVALTLPILTHWYLYRQASSRELPRFLLLGPSGAGKTSLMTLLANGVPAETHTSLATAPAARCALPAGKRAHADRFRSEHDPTTTGPGRETGPAFSLIDTPGHGKLRGEAMRGVLGDGGAVRGVVFVVDSAGVSSEAGLADAGEYLHDALLTLQRRQARATGSKGAGQTAVLVAANKQDVFTALPAGVVRARLEEEIGRARATRSRGLRDSGVGADGEGGGDDEDDERNWLGEYGSTEFRFGQMEEHGIGVQVAGGNVREAEAVGDVDEWWAWIADNL